MLIRRLDNYMERHALARCAYIIYNTPTAKTLMDAKYPAYAGKTFVITNGIIAQDIKDAKGRETNGRFFISHIGALYGDRNPSDFFIGLKRWIDEKGSDFRDKVVVNFVGRGTDRIIRVAEKYGVAEVVKTHEQKSKEALLKILAETDMFLLCLGYRSASKYVIPAKMYDYIGAERPVMAFGPADGEVFNLMKKLGLEENVVFNPDPDKVRRILDREHGRCVLEREHFSVSSEFKEQYDYSLISERIKKVIELAMNDTTP